MFQDLPATGAGNSRGSSLNGAGKQGPEGGASAPSGSTITSVSSQSTHAAADSAPADAPPPAFVGAQPSHQSPLGSHQGEGASSPSAINPPLADGSQDAPPTVFSGIPVRAIEDVMACRAEQIFTYGHTPEKDRETDLWSAREFGGNGKRSFMRQLAAQLSAAIEYAAFGRAKHDITRRKLVRLAALCLAAIDRIDAEAAEDEAQP